MKKKSNQNLKKIAIIGVAIAIILLIVLIIALSFKNSSKLELNDFERIAIYNYLENDLLDVFKLYQLSGKSDYNELQVFQSKLKQALDTYFSSYSENVVSAYIALGLVDSRYVPESVDFNGIVISDYNYNPENNSFEKAPGANSNIAGIEAEINNLDYSDKRASVQKIEVTNDKNYKVFFNIISINFDNTSTEATGEAIVSVKDNELKLESCSLSE